MSKRVWLVELLLSSIITIPAFLSLLNGSYFSMHDDQHIARLYLLDQGIKQGNIFPRWVGGLGFGFGYPLFNFYPPLVYYIAEIFHILGFSYIWSIKLTFLLGFVLAGAGIYFLVKKILKDRYAAFLGVSLYTFFFYHAVLIYVRGALAEFFSLAILPFVFLTLGNSWVWFGLTFALLILVHPLIALPSLFFLGLATIYYWRSLGKIILGGVFGLALSAFFWLPSMFERQYTLVDTILTSELANYKLHYIFPSQFLYSPWGYGGSGSGLTDGMTFQLGKINIALVLGALILSLIYFFKKRKLGEDIKSFYFFTLLLLFSLFMTTEYSSFIWDRVKYLWYMQFPWRFLTFVALFISIVGSYAVVFLEKKFKNFDSAKKTLLVITIIVANIFIYQKYFSPQNFVKTTDSEKTSFNEISWRISGTSYEFVPKGVKTAKSKLGTTILDVKRSDLPKNPYSVIANEIESVDVVENKFAIKKFLVSVYRQTEFRLNTYNFPGWSAYLDGKKISITDDNDLKLITVQIPVGKHSLTFKFEDTPIKGWANIISILAMLILARSLFRQFKKVDH